MLLHRRVICGALVVLALVAASCRADAPHRGIAAEPPSQPDRNRSTPAPASPGRVPPAATPTVEPTPTRIPLDVERPPTSTVPAEWNDPLPLDSSVVQGNLANGMRYLVRDNAAPGGQAQLRLVVRAGSLHESDGRHGVAHFLEHMLFNGTERFPRNELVQVLEGFGSGFGPEVNAYTGYGETVYELELPARDLDTVQLGLDVLHQWATAASLDRQAVIDERGVVREEYRRRVESLRGRISAEVLEVLFAGTDYLDRDPIGVIEVIDTMDERDVRTFYERWYRPDLMTVVAVGDFDPATMERRIIDTFGAETTDTPTPSLTIDFGQAGLAQATFDVLIDAEITTADVEVLWRLETAPVRTPSDLRKTFVVALAVRLLDERLLARTQSDAVLVSASTGHGGLTPVHQLVSLAAKAEPQDLGAALAAVLTEFERARQFGFSDDEFAQVVQSLKASVEQDFAESATRQDEDIAADLVGFALDGATVLSAQDRHRVSLEVLASITTADVQAFLFDLLESEPYVLATAPARDEASVPTPEQFASIYDATVGMPVEPNVAPETAATALMERPEPVAFVDQRWIEELGASVVTYENGVRLAYRMTSITENLVELRAVSPGGFFAVTGPAVPLLGRLPSLVSGSGFASIDIVTLRRLLAGSVASLSSSIGRAEERLDGRVSTIDLETLFQLVHLHMTDPTLSESSIRQFDAGMRPIAEDPVTRPTIAANLELWRLRYGDSPWFRLIPTVADLDGFDRDLLLEAYKDRFADAGDFLFVIVGDFDERELLELGGRYLGTLPDRGRREEPIDRDPGVPEANLVATVEAGIGDQGRIIINWEAPYPFTLEAEVAAEALELVVDARLRDVVREELGATYSPSADVVVLSEPKPWIDTVIEVETDPARIEEVSNAIRAEVERLRDGELDQIYLDAAVDQMVEGYRYSTNANWIDRIVLHVTHPERAAVEFRSRRATAESLTIADLAAAAQAAFPAQRSVEVRLVPAAE